MRDCYDCGIKDACEKLEMKKFSFYVLSEMMNKEAYCKQYVDNDTCDVCVLKKYCEMMADRGAPIPYMADNLFEEEEHKIKHERLGS